MAAKLGMAAGRGLPVATAVTRRTAAAVALAGCGSIALPGSNGAQQQAVLHGTPKQALLAAMSSTRHQSYDFTLEATMSGLGGAAAALGSSLGADATGTFSAPQDAIRMQEAVTSGSAQGILGSLTSGGKSPSNVKTTILLFLKTGSAYVSVQGLGTALPKPWIKENLGAFSGLSDSDPSSYLNSVAPYVVSTKTVGRAVIDGTQTTELAVTENARAMIEKALGSGLGSQIDSLMGGSTGGNSMAPEVVSWIKSAFQALPPSLVLHVWIDSQDRLRQVQMSLPLGPFFQSLFSHLFSAIGNSGGDGISGSTGVSGLQPIVHSFENMSMSMTMTLSRYGIAAHITPPPAGEVESASSVSSSATQQAAGSAGSAGSATSG